MSSEMNYYEVLGVTRDVDSATLKRTYFNLVRTCHPDIFPNDNVKEEQFKKLNEAYAVLSNPDKRASYDRYGHASLERNFQPSRHGFLSVDIAIEGPYASMFAEAKITGDYSKVLEFARDEKEFGLFRQDATKFVVDAFMKAGKMENIVSLANDTRLPILGFGYAQDTIIKTYKTTGKIKKLIAISENSENNSYFRLEAGKTAIWMLLYARDIDALASIAERRKCPEEICDKAIEFANNLYLIGLAMNDQYDTILTLAQRTDIDEKSRTYAWMTAIFGAIDYSIPEVRRNIILKQTMDALVMPGLTRPENWLFLGYVAYGSVISRSHFSVPTEIRIAAIEALDRGVEKFGSGHINVRNDVPPIFGSEWDMLFRKIGKTKLVVWNARTETLNSINAGSFSLEAMTEAKRLERRLGHAIKRAPAIRPKNIT